MLGSVLFGSITALGWGSADFIARFTGRAMGHKTALMGMLGISAVVLTLVVWIAKPELVTTWTGWWLVVLSGIGIMTATLFLYWGLERGPVTVVAPIVGAYPAFNLAFAVITGVRPSAWQWAAMALVIIGVVIVAACAEIEAPDEYEDIPDRSEITKTILIALTASLAFALTVATAQEAMAIYGELQTIWLARWVGFAAIVLLFLLRREKPRMPLRWWPVLTVQGVLDASAYVSLLYGSQGIGAQLTVVIGSSFSAVTVILAKIFLHEPMSWRQWAGIGAILTGVIMISVYK